MFTRVPSRAKPLAKGSLGLGLAATLSLLGCGSDVDLAVASEVSQSQELGFQPRLGTGVNFAETKTYRRCVTTPTTTTPHTFKNRLYDELAIKDRNELNRTLNIDASVSAKGLWGEASGSASYFKNVQMSSDAFYWLVNAEYRLVDEGIDTGDPAFALTDEAKRILSGPDGLAAFYRACGDQFYSGSTKGAHYALLYEFKSLEEKTIERIKAMASFQGWGVNAKASFEELSELASKSSVLKIHSMTEGGSDRLSSYARNPDALEGELSKLRDDLYNHGKGIDVQWFISDYNMFPEVAEAKFRATSEQGAGPLRADKLLKEKALSRLYTRYTRNVDLYQHLSRKLESAAGPEPLYAFEPKKITRIRQALRELERANTAISERGRECIERDEAEACATSDALEELGLTDEEVEDIGTPDRDNTTLQGWSLHFEQVPGAARFLRLAGKPFPGAPLTTFNTGYSLLETDVGILARADEGQDVARLVGTADRVRDPSSRQFRPLVCVYNYADACSLRIVSLGDDADPLAVKLQMVLFDKYGFVEERLDFAVDN